MAEAGVQQQPRPFPRQRYAKQPRPTAAIGAPIVRYPPVGKVRAALVAPRASAAVNEELDEEVEAEFAVGAPDTRLGPQAWPLACNVVQCV